jgi:hypothetical protein
LSVEALHDRLIVVPVCAGETRFCGTLGFSVSGADVCTISSALRSDSLPPASSADTRQP